MGNPWTATHKEKREEDVRECQRYIEELNESRATTAGEAEGVGDKRATISQEKVQDEL